MDVSVNSVSNNMNQSSNLSLKRNISSSVQLRESRMKARRMSMNTDVHKSASPVSNNYNILLFQCKNINTKWLRVYNYFMLHCYLCIVKYI